MPIPLLVLGVAAAGAWAALRNPSTAVSGDTAAGDDVGPAQDIVQSTDTASSATVDPTGLSARTLSWQAELTAQAPDLETGVLLRWIQRESDGNPSAVGSTAQLQRDGWAREAGIGQVYFESRAQAQFGTTSDELRAGSAPGVQTMTRELTEAERGAQTGSLIAMLRRYIADGQSVLSSVGQTWSETDVYCLAKLKHALPVLARAFLVRAGDAATDWDAFRAWLEALSVTDSVAIYSGSATYYPWSRYLNNAQYTGRGG